uniref:Uncharacterized protein n=1 Tax=Phenylobacterium glaciei TaxID=2803784 RepID=A0A974S9N7_9CAUL|nr:hypothetical protein JKL49_06075 [Phenylobacterium glaciei]
MTQTWMDKSLSPDNRAKLLIAQLTLDEMITLVHGPMPAMVTRRRPTRPWGQATSPGSNAWASRR